MPTKPKRAKELPAREWRKFAGSAPYVQMIEAAAQKHGISPEVLGALLYTESRFNPNARGPTGDRGIAQIVTKWHPEVRNPFDPAESIEYAAGYLGRLKRRFGSTEKALAAYNHGPTAVSGYGKDWRTKIPSTTRHYASSIAEAETAFPTAPAPAQKRGKLRPQAAPVQLDPVIVNALLRGQ